MPQGESGRMSIDLSRHYVTMHRVRHAISIQSLVVLRWAIPQLCAQQAGVESHTRSLGEIRRFAFCSLETIVPAVSTCYPPSARKGPGPILGLFRACSSRTGSSCKLVRNFCRRAPLTFVAPPVGGHFAKHVLRPWAARAGALIEVHEQQVGMLTDHPQRRPTLRHDGKPR